MLYLKNEKIAMEQVEEKCSNESEKCNEVFKKKKTNNAQFLPPMGVVIILCTLMLAGRSIKQNFCIAYSDLMPPKLEITTIKPVENKQSTTEIPKKVTSKQQLLIDSTSKVTIKEEIALNKNDNNNNSEKKLAATTKETTNIKSNKNEFKTEAAALDKLPKAKKLNLETVKRIDGASLLNKQRTSEPIIYLFVFVFIYLLLKSVADINSHYKTKMQGDNRLRRYSLQSYAQIHRYEQRRASRVQSNDIQQEQAQNIINMDNLAIGQKQFVQQNKFDNKEDLQNYMQRRSSMPAVPVLHYRHRKLGSLGTTLSLRRDSILTSNNNLTILGATGSQLAADGTEIRRRVRMINRH